MEESVTLPLEAPNPVSIKQDLLTGTKHILAPALIGAAVGGGWQVYGIPVFDSVFTPNPPQFALLVILALTPLMYRVLVHTSFERCLEYTFGFAVLALPLCVVWLSGWGALFCGMYAILLSWGCLSMLWGRRQLPPFSYGLWHAMGVDLGAFAGAVAVYSTIS